MTPKITILLPCLNEEQTLAFCIAQAQAYFQHYQIEGEVLVSDNGSTDHSIYIAKSLGARVINVPTKGYGAALRAGIKASQAEFIVMGDADSSYDFSQLEEFLHKLEEGYDLVIGNRFAGGIDPHAMPFLNHYLGTPVLSWIGRRLFHSKIKDFNCGLRAVRKSKLLSLPLQSTGMEFASEMIAQSELHHLKITQTPTPLHRDGRDRPPHLHPWKDGWRHLRLMLIYGKPAPYLLPAFLSLITGLGLELWSPPSSSFRIISLLLSPIFFFIGAQLFLGFAFIKGYAVIHGHQSPSPFFHFLIPKSILLCPFLFLLGFLFSLPVLIATAIGSFFLWSLIFWMEPSGVASEITFNEL